MRLTDSTESNCGYLAVITLYCYWLLLLSIITGYRVVIETTGEICVLYLKSHTIKALLISYLAVTPTYTFFDHKSGCENTNDREKLLINALAAFSSRYHR